MADCTIKDSTKRVPYPEFFGHNGTCTGTGTSTKVLGSAPSDRQTDRQKLWLYLAAFQC